MMMGRGGERGGIKCEGGAVEQGVLHGCERRGLARLMALCIMQRPMGAQCERQILKFRG